MGIQISLHWFNERYFEDILIIWPCWQLNKKYSCTLKNIKMDFKINWVSQTLLCCYTLQTNCENDTRDDNLYTCTILNIVLLISTEQTNWLKYKMAASYLCLKVKEGQAYYSGVNMRKQLYTAHLVFECPYFLGCLHRCPNKYYFWDKLKWTTKEPHKIIPP